MAGLKNDGIVTGLARYLAPVSREGALALLENSGELEKGKIVLSILSQAASVMFFEKIKIKTLQLMA